MIITLKDWINACETVQPSSSNRLKYAFVTFEKQPLTVIHTQPWVDDATLNTKTMFAFLSDGSILTAQRNNEALFFDTSEDDFYINFPFRSMDTITSVTYDTMEICFHTQNGHVGVKPFGWLMFSLQYLERPLEGRSAIQRVVANLNGVSAHDKLNLLERISA